MKPSFALDLSHDGLSLLRRAKGGWQVIGSVALDDTDMPEKLRYLRRTASELAGGQLASKLVIPNSEVFYKTVDAPGASEAERAAKVRDTLEGATPYAVDDLAFDWVNAGEGKAHIAAVARTTLAEAENFADEHRFNPVSFVAIPEDGTFVGEPFFGETNLCATLLPSGETVENDPGPIKVVGNHDPDSVPDAIEPTIEEEAEAAISEQDKDPEPHKVGKTKNPKPKRSKKPKLSEKKSDPVVDDIQPTFNSTREGVENDADLPNIERVAARFALYPDKIHSEPADAVDKPKVLVTPMPVTAPDIASDELPDDLQKQLADIEKTPTAPVIEKPKPSPAPVVKAPVAMTAPHPTPSAKRTIFDDREPNQGENSRRVLGMTIGLGLAALVLLAVLLSSIFIDRPIALSRLWGGLDKTAELATPETLEPALINTDTELSTDPVQTNLSDQQIASIQDAPVADLSDQEIDTAPAAINPDGSPPGVETSPDQSALGEITFEEAVVIQSSTGVWVLAPNPPVRLESEVLDNFYVASIDPLLLSHDAVALPDVSNALNDFRPGDFFSPPPAGTVFDLDERGFVRPTTEGALSANGVIVFKGRPKYTAKPRPTDAEWYVAPSEVIGQVLVIPKKRPTARPDNLVQTNERAQLGGLTRSELATIKPMARPASPQEMAPQVDLTPTELAVERSRTPTQRPANFATTVAVAIAANAQLEVVQTAAAVATPQIPSIPTTASVAREATNENAINLSHVNLIGVYGSSGSRRALVRLKSGRYVKVQIGDRLDGGKVAAIKGDKLQYVKGGRMVTLEIAS